MSSSSTTPDEVATYVAVFDMALGAALRGADAVAFIRAQA